MKLVVLGKQAGLFRKNREFDAGLNAFAQTGDRALYDYLVRLCHATGFFKGRLRSRSFNLPYSQGEVTGNTPVGKVVDTDFVYGIDSDHITRHVAIAGTTGQGKTVFLLNLINALLEADRKVICFDVKGTDFDGLVAKFGIVKIHYSELMFNILRPPKNIPIEAWKRRLTMVLAEMLGLLLASTGQLYKYIDRVFQKWSGKIYPCLKEVLDEVRGDPKLSGKSGNYQDTVGNRIDTITDNLGQQFFCRTDFMEDLMHQSWILDLSDATPVEQDMLLGPLLAYIYEWHRANVPRDRLWELVTAIFIDEANQNILSVKKTYSAQTFTNSFEQYVNLSRSQGIGFVTSFQSPSQVMQGFIHNAHLRVSFGLGSGREIDITADFLGLNPQQKHMLYHLQQGECIVRRGSGFTEAALLQGFFRQFPEPTDETWESNERKVKELQALGERYSPDDVKGPEFVGMDLSINGEKVLLAIGSRPISTMMEVYENARLGTQGNRAKDELTRKEYIQEFPIKGGGRGKPKSALLTQKGIQAYKNKANGNTPRKPIPTQRASYVHDWHVNRVASHFKELGAEFKIAHRLDRHEADLVVMLDGVTTAYEITLTTEKKAQDKIPLLDHVNHLVYLYTDKIQLKKIQSGLSVPEELASRIGFEPLSQFVSKRN